jgi:hypothetical protein
MTGPVTPRTSGREPGRPAPGRPPLHVGARTRVAAWVVTGPVGHLYGGVADWAELLARYALGSARSRLRPGPQARPHRDRPS